MPQSKPRVGILNGGGDCPGLNTVIDTIVCTLASKYEILGFFYSFEGLLAKNYEILTPQKTWPFRFTGGTILRSMNKGLFNSKLSQGQTRELPADLKTQTYRSYQELGLEALFCLGGDGTMTIAQQFSKCGMNIIGVPKSIDNDLLETDFTFGFWTAVETISQALDKLRTTVASHGKIMIVETMGRYAGWLALYGGLAGGAEVILLPEITVNYDNLLKYLHAWKKQEKQADGLLIVVAEGLDRQALSQKILDRISQTQELSNQQKKEQKQENQDFSKDLLDQSFNFFAEKKLGNVVGNLLAELLRLENFEVRSLVLGHLQRGGSPNAFDRILSRQLGAYACQLLEQKKFNTLVVYKNNQVTAVNLAQGVAQLKLLPIQSQLLELASKQGIYFGQ